ncbi:MAG: hypothetical protein JO306_16585 [Gemmatimonadetes bacterium]|nr:hypothetical protein [Gemmatimonadota bacterium]
MLGPEPTGSWRPGPAGITRDGSVPDGVGRRLERRVSIRGDMVQPDHGAAESGLEARSLTDLRVLTRAAVRATLRAERRGVGLDGEVLQLLRLACDIARINDTFVERVLILLKEAWREHPEARPRCYADAEDTLARVITLCIEEYYAPFRSS